MPPIPVQRLKRKSRLQRERDLQDEEDGTIAEMDLEQKGNQQTRLLFGANSKRKGGQQGQSRLSSLLNQLDDGDEDEEEVEEEEEEEEEKKKEIKKCVEVISSSSSHSAAVAAHHTASDVSGVKRAHHDAEQRNIGQSNDDGSQSLSKRKRIAAGNRTVGERIMPRSQHVGATVADLPASAKKLRPHVPPSNVQSSWRLQGDTLPFFFMDAYETRKGDVILLGKTGVQRDSRTGNFTKWESCAVRVCKLVRTVYLFPRESPLDDPSDVRTLKKEVRLAAQTLVEQCGIPFKSQPPYNGVKLRATKKHYVFEEATLPHQKDLTFIEMHIPAQRPDGTSNGIINLPENHAVFGHLFGATSSYLETLLLRQRIMGPCWLSIKVNPSTVHGFSHCRHEFEAEGYESVARSIGKAEAIPRAVSCAVKVMTMLSADNKVNEIVSISGIVHSDFDIDGETKESDIETHAQSFTFCRRQLDKNSTVIEMSSNNSGIHLCKDEKQILEKFLDFMYRTDPDVVVGHNFVAFDLDVLLHRMKRFDIRTFSRLGRINLKHFPKLQNNAGGMGESTWEEKAVMSGRLVCDTYLAAREYLRESSYSLASLAQTQLKREKVEIDYDMHAIRPYYQSLQMLHTLARHCEHDALLATLLMNRLTLLPLSKQMTNIAGNLWSRTLTGNRAERIEFLLLHKFFENNFIIPDKQLKRQSSSGRRKAAYSGGMVFEPKKGLYDTYILLLDFNSLYPSIIREYNICFASVKRNKNAVLDAATKSSPATKEPHPTEEATVVDETDPMYQLSLLPRVITDLIEERRKVKFEMSKATNADKRWQLDNQQQALKLTANSTYGCLGFHLSRFFCQPMAELITRSGRDILMQTKRIIEESLNMPVIYGDTDSLMVLTTETDYTRAEALGKKIIQEINMKHRYLEIGIDGLLRRILLLRKKKYAAVLHSKNPKDNSIIEKMETKGLDQVRRDWCPLSKQASQFCLDQILNGSGSEEEVVNMIHNYLRELGQTIRDGKIDLDQFVLSKSLTKLPEEYADAKLHPHVQVAMRMRDQRNQPIRVGVRIPYVIGVKKSSREQNMDTGAEDGGKKLSLGDRAYSPEEIKESNGSIEVDYEWYLSQQVFPPVFRLCEHMNGTDGSFLAECLGLDKTKYRGSVSYADEQDDVDSYTFMNDLMGTEDETEKYRNCRMPPLACGHCGTNVEFAIQDKILRCAQSRRDGNTDATLQLMCCQNCGEALSAGRVMNHIQMAIRDLLTEFYCGWLCTPANSTDRTRIAALTPSGYGVLNGRIVGIRCEVSAQDLHLSLQYFVHLFDWDNACKQLLQRLTKDKSSDDLRRFVEKVIEDAPQDEAESSDSMVKLERVKTLVLRYLNKCARRYVDLSNLFSMVVKT